MFKKNSLVLEDVGVKDRATLILTVSDKSSSRHNADAARERKALKDEPKVPIIYTLRNAADVPKAEEPVAADAVEMINTSTVKEKAREEHMIEMLPSTKLRHLKQAIKDDLGIKDKVNIKLYLPISDEKKKEEEQEEQKEGEVTPQQPLIEGSYLVLVDDKLTIREAGILEQRDKLEVEVFIRVSIDVQGKGKDYSATIDVTPADVILPTLQARLGFFKTFFYQRRMQLFITAKDEAPVLIDDLGKTFREWGLKEDGVSLQLREPARRNA